MNYSDLPAEEVYPCFLYEYSLECIKKFKLDNVPKYWHLHIALAIDRYGQVPWSDITKDDSYREFIISILNSKDRTLYDLTDQLKDIDRNISYLEGIVRHPDADNPNPKDSISKKDLRHIVAIILTGLRPWITSEREPNCFDFENTILLNVDWNQSDTAIIKRFSEVLKDRRIENPMTTESLPVNFVLHPLESLPFKPITALDWLTVWRRRESVGNWNEYVDEFKGESIDLESFNRAEREKYSKASLILNCLAKGGKIISERDGRALKHIQGEVD